MNQTFNFKRFGTYFKYDLTQMWRNHSKAAILIGGASAIFYILWVLFSLVFAQEWHAPMIEARAVVFIIAFTILEFYQVKTYGHLTEKRAGSSWLMIPASRAEKFVSMLLITLIVIPLLFLAVYGIIDGFLSLVDPTYGKALVAGFAGVYAKLVEGLAEINGQIDLNLSTATLVFTSVLGFFCNFLYFLLCGICFKRNKLVAAFAILFAFSVVMSVVMGFVGPAIVENWPNDIDWTEDMVISWTNGIMNFSVIMSILMTVGFGWGVWYRIKTLQH
jgi:hypothetical protein